MDKRRYQTELRHFKRNQSTDTNEEFTPGNGKRVVKYAARRAAKYTLKFAADKAKFKFKDSKSRSSLNFEDIGSLYSSGTSSTSKLKFEEDIESKYGNHTPPNGHNSFQNARSKSKEYEKTYGSHGTSAPSASKLKFEEDGSSKYGNYPPPIEYDSVGKPKGKSKLKFGSKIAEETVDYIDELSENEGVKGSNVERKVLSRGGNWGFTKGSRWRKNHSLRVEKRKIKAKTNEMLREIKEQQHQLKYGRPSFLEKQRQKRLALKRQMKSYAEKKVGVEAAAKIEQLVIKTAKGVAAIIRAAVAYIGAPLLGVILILGLMFMLAYFISTAFMSLGTTTTMSYTAEPNAIEQASCHYTKLEAQLEKKIKDIPMSWEWGHIDEFRYDLDPIGHDAYQIMAYLNVKYPGFNLEDPLIWQQVQTEIDYIFDARYELILDEEVEIRTYEDTSTDEFGNETSTTVEYPYYILNVILHSKEQEPLLLTELNRNPEEELVEWYGVLQETQGARQDYANPFGIYDWRGSVSSLYGWRIDPIGGRELQMHHGLDIAMPRGTPIFAGLDGFVDYTGFDPIMGNFIAISDNKGRTIKYGHCDGISVSNGQAVVAGSSVIGTVGSSGQSTGAHLHVEILENGGFLDPIYSLQYLPLGA